MADLHEALESKYDEIESGIPAEQPAPVEPVAEPEQLEIEPPKEERPRDESGRFIETKEEKPKAEKPVKAPPAPKPSVTPQPAAGVTTQTPAPEKPVVSQTKPPQSWKPTEREAWNALPPVAQQAVLRREREIQIALQQAAEQSKVGGSFAEAVRPYEVMFRQAGVPAEQYVGDMLRTAHAITQGPPHVQADALAGLIVSSAAHLLQPDRTDANGNPSCPLDRALVARMGNRGAMAPMAAPQPQADPRALVREELAAIQNQAYEQRAQAQAGELAEKLEFFGDVHETMADIIAMWDKQGKTFVTEDDLQRAYTLACSMDPEVSKIMEQRKAAASVETRQAATQRAKVAASSVRTQPSAAPAAQTAAGRRAALEAAYDDVESR
ncbi:MAG TPA: hypothetical protein VFH83_01555 [Spirochaetia bacterium]|nr:hypothetical protein [Spirochaetia bacterium]